MRASLDLTTAVNKALEEAKREMGKVNVLIAGRTGVGKSTLINSIFHGRVAATGQGEPVTQTTRLISKEGIPLAIWDTRELEMSAFEETLGELTQLVEKRATDPEAQNHIHVAWLCLHEDGSRVEPAETKLCRALAQHMPVLGVITKARRDDGFRDEVQRLLPEAKNVVRVRAIAEKFDYSGHSLPPMGLDDLVELTAAALPEGIRRAFVAAQMVSLRDKAQQAHAVIGTGATSAAAAVPIPLADAVILVPIQVSMLAGISVVFGLDTSKAFLGVLVATATGTTGTTLVGRAIVANLLKFIPGGGTVVGGAISAATAGALTTVLGEIYLVSLVAVFTRTGGKTPEIDAVTREFTERVKAATDDSLLLQEAQVHGWRMARFRPVTVTKEYHSMPTIPCLLTSRPSKRRLWSSAFRCTRRRDRVCAVPSSGSAAWTMNHFGKRHAPMPVGAAPGSDDTAGGASSCTATTPVIA